MAFTRRRRNRLPRTSLDLEHVEQSRFVAHLSQVNCVEARWTYAVPNGFLKTSAMRLRGWEEGVRAGVWDVHAPFARMGYKGLYLEFKVNGNTLSKEQREFRTAMEQEGHLCLVVHTADEALDAWADYFDFDIVRRS